MANSEEAKPDLNITKSHRLYAVANGREVGIFSDLKLCELSTKGFSGSKFSRFEHMKQARKFLNENGLDTSDINIISSIDQSPALMDYCITNQINISEFMDAKDPDNVEIISQARLFKTGTDNHTEAKDPEIAEESSSVEYLFTQHARDSDEILFLDTQNSQLSNPQVNNPEVDLGLPKFNETIVNENKSNCTSKYVSCIPQMTDAETNTISSELQCTADLNLCYRLTETLSAINLQLNLKDDIRQLEEKLVHQLIDSERTKNQLKLELLQKDLNHANDIIKELKKEIKIKDSDLKNNQNISDKLYHSKMENEELKLAHAHENSKLSIKCELLLAKNEELKSTITKLKTNEEALAQEMETVKTTNNELLTKLCLKDEEITRLSYKLSNLQDEILAQKLNDEENNGFIKQKKTYKEPQTETEMEITHENRFKLLSTDHEFDIPNNREQKTKIIKEPVANTDAKYNTEPKSTSNKTDVLIIGNSHVSRINPKKIYKNKNCSVHQLESKGILGAVEYIEQCTVKDPEIIVYQVASNDLVSFSADLCTQETEKLLEKTWAKYPGAKICICEALPRELNSISDTTDYLDKLKKYNKSLQNLGQEIKVIKHRNIDQRRQNLWSDKIHLSNTGMALLIKNYKTVLNPLLGMKPYEEYYADQGMKLRRNTNISPVQSSLMEHGPFATNPQTRPSENRNQQSNGAKYSQWYPQDNKPSWKYKPNWNNWSENTKESFNPGFLSELESLINYHKNY